VLASSPCNALRLLDAGTTLTIGAGLTVRGQSGRVGSAANCLGVRPV